MKFYGFIWFGKALDAVCAHGHVVIAKRIHALHPEPLATKRFANAAAHGHLEMLQWLSKHRYDQLCIEHPPSQAQGVMNCYFKFVASGAVANGHVGIVHWLFVTGLIALRVLRSLSVGIARAGSLEISQWFHEKAPTAIAMPNWFDGALERGDLSMAQHLHSLGVTECSATSVSKAIVYGTQELEAFMRSKFYVYGRPRRAKMLEDAAFHGRLDVLMQHRSFLPSCDNYGYGIYSNAARGLQLECMQWACTEMIMTPSVSASLLNRAMIEGRIDFLQWVNERDCGNWAIRPSTRLTKTAVVQWLFQHRRTIFLRLAYLLTHELMDTAAEGGNLELVQWLERQDGVGCSTNAMDLAAANGHLEVVQCIHHNRTEGCTTAAITEAARRGHVEVAMWV